MRPVPPLRRDDVLIALAGDIEAALAHQRPDGGVLEPAWGLPAPMRAAQLAVSVALVPPELDDAAQARRVAGAAAALAWLSGSLRPGGRVDLPTTNPDSAPDTAFVVQLLAMTALAIRDDRSDLEPLLEPLRSLVGRCVGGMADGGFHTPNHRWVLASAIALGLALDGASVPTETAEVAEATLASYLGEGFDLDDDGVWIERSAGAYDAVNDRSLLLLAETGRVARTEVLDLVVRNLELDIDLLHADGTIEVGLSTRQDHGTRTVPHELAAVMLWAGGLAASERLAGTAAWILGHGTPEHGARIWTAWALRHDDRANVPATPPEDATRTVPKHGLWRHRSGALSATVRGHEHDLLSVHVGSVAIHAVGLHHTYFGPLTGRFLATSVDLGRAAVVMHSTGDLDPRRPGYELPLGERVHPDDWESRREDRDLRRLPPLRTTIHVAPVERGVEVRVSTGSGLDGVPAVLYLDLAAGATWHTDHATWTPDAGQTVLLRDGHLRVVQGEHAVRIGPGGAGHGMAEPRNLPPRSGIVRLLVPLVTPIDHTLTIESAPVHDLAAPGGSS